MHLAPKLIFFIPIVIFIIIFFWPPFEENNVTFSENEFGISDSYANQQRVLDWLKGPANLAADSQKIKKDGSKFRRPPLTEGLDCGRLFTDDEEFISKIAQSRISLSDPAEDFPVDCASINSRHYFPTEPQSEAEAFYPLAQARIVYKDYLLVEMELAAGYAPQNWYCFAVDRKSDNQFHRRMRSLANCFPNVFLLKSEYSVDSDGHNITSAYMDCMKLLADPLKEWRYVTLLQNHDISLRTNRELIQIFIWMNGANDVEALQAREGRYNSSLDWTFKGLRLFRNKTRNELSSQAGFPPILAHSKSTAQCSLTREMVDFMLNELDLSEFLQRIEHGGYGTDEMMIPTLNAADALEAPGGFTRACIDKKVESFHITRLTIWVWGNESREAFCPTDYVRHGICVFGVENLSRDFENSKFLFANKMIPQFDFGAIACWHERLFNRSYLQPADSVLARLSRNFYVNMPHVRYQKVKAIAKRKGLSPSLNNFDCNWPSD